MNVPATTTISLQSMPSPQPDDIARGMMALTSGAIMDGVTMVLLPGREIGDAFRLGLQARMKHLDSRLAHRDREQARSIVAQTLASFPSMRAGPDEAKFVISAYLAVLDDLPPWALAEAAREPGLKS